MQIKSGNRYAFYTIFLASLLIHSSTIASGELTSQILDPKIEHRWTTEGTITDIDVFEDIAIIANGDKGISILNISDPHSPTEIGTFDNGGIAWTVLIDYPLAYVADLGDGLEILNISNPHNPTLIHTLNVGGQPRCLSIQNDLIYVVTNYNDLIVYNISSPVSPERYSNFAEDAFSNAWSVVISEDIAYIAGGRGGLKVIDISNPRDISKIGSWDDGGDLRDIAIQDKTLFLADVDDGLEIVDVTDPSQPSEIGKYSRYDITNLDVHDNLAILSSDKGQFIFMDLKDLTSPKRLENLDATAGYGILIKNSIAFLCDGTNGLVFADSGYDQDGDDLSDFKEIYVYGTLVNNEDSDDDGMWDGWEVEYNLNPNNPSDASEDFDGDNLTNIQEFEQDLDPTNTDTDSDGFQDDKDPFPNSFMIPTGLIALGMVLVILIIFLLCRVKKINAPSTPAQSPHPQNSKNNALLLNAAVSFNQKSSSQPTTTPSKPTPIPFPSWKSSDSPPPTTALTKTPTNNFSGTEHQLLDKFQKIMLNTWEVEVGFLTHSLQLKSDQETLKYLYKWKKFLPIEIVQNVVIVHDTEEFHRVVEDYFRRMNADTSINFFEKP